jgi:signal peptidase I
VEVLSPTEFNFYLTRSAADKMKNFGNVKKIEPNMMTRNIFQDFIFPFNSKYGWNVDNFGPVWIPKKGSSLAIDSSNIDFYRKVISEYEGNKLEERNGQIFINGSVTVHTFR